MWALPLLQRRCAMQSIRKIPQEFAAIGIGLAVLAFFAAAFVAFLNLAQF